MILLTKTELNNPALFKKKKEDYIKSLKEIVQKESNINFEFDELGDLLISVCRANVFNVVRKYRRKMLLNEKDVLRWLKEKLIPNTVIMSIDDEEIIRLLLFSLEITYQMLEGGTKATMTQKGFRERRRSFEAILVDQFAGKFGEVVLKKFLEKQFSAKIELDWEISRSIDRFRNDIVNAKNKISIKTSPSLTGIWAEADIGYDYGVYVKSSMPKHIILQFFIEVYGFSRLIEFAEARISDNKFKDYLEKIKGRIEISKCGDLKTKFKGFIEGYFKTAEFKPIRKGKKLPYLGEVRESRYLVPISKLRYTKNDWEDFLIENALI